MKLMKHGSALVAAQILGLALVVGSGCSQIKDAQDKMNTMADTTKKVSDTSDKMAKTTDHMSTKTDDMDEKTTDLLGLSGELQNETLSLYLKERQGATLEVRKDMINQMNAATTMEMKIFYAAAYFKAFEFQVWGGVQDDDFIAKNKLDQPVEVLYDCAAKELFRTMKEYMPDDFRQHPQVDPTNQDNKSMNFYALAVTMHEMNPLHIKLPIEKDATPDYISMFDLIKRGLAKKDGVNSGKILRSDLLDWQKEVLTDAAAFEYLIRARANFLPVMVLAQVSNIGHKGFLRIPQLWNEAKMFLFGWTADMNELNAEELETYTRWLHDPLGADATRAELQGLGVDATIDKKVLKLYRKMKIEDPKNIEGMTMPGPNGAPSILDQFKKAVQDIRDIK